MALVSALPPPAEQPKHPILYIRPNSNVQGVGTTIASSIREDERVTLRAIGAGAVNQAIKSCIQARQQLSAQGEDMIVKPGFTTVVGNDGSDVTAVVLHCLLL
jgi:stage V sporulation protein S